MPGRSPLTRSTGVLDATAATMASVSATSSRPDAEASGEACPRGL